MLIRDIIGFDGHINFDDSKPDGAPKKLMDTGLINSLGWKPKIKLEAGLELTYKDFLSKKYD